MTRVTKWRVVVGTEGQEDAWFDVWIEGGQGHAENVANILSAWQTNRKKAGTSQVQLQPVRQEGWILHAVRFKEGGAN